MTDRNCETYQLLASALVDSELRTTEIETLQEHLKGCEACRSFLGNAYRVGDLLRAGEAQGDFQPVADGFAAGITARIARERFTVAPPAVKRPSAPSFVRRWSAAAAAAVLVLSVGWSWHRLSGPEEILPAGRSVPVAAEAAEGSMASYLSQHAMQSMDATFLGPTEGIELASFEVLGQNFE